MYREAVESDLPAICVLGEDVNAMHHRAWPHVFSGPGDPTRHIEHWKQSIGIGTATTFVAEEMGVVVGFVTVNIVDETHSLLQPSRYGRVGSLSVAVEHRSRGLGRELMVHAERWAMSHGASDIRLNVWAFNETALRLYEELGYEVRSYLLGKRC